MQARRCLGVLLVLTVLTTTVTGGPAGRIQVPQVPEGSISIDGSFSDWPLNSFTTPSQQPEWPEGQGEETDALGDHLLFESDRVHYFGAGGSCHEGPCAVLNNSPGDFGAAIYMTYDSTALYFLGVVLDDFMQGGMDESEFGDNTFRNDGFEIFVDTFNDTDDSAADLRNPPNVQFDDEEPNLDDFQVSFGLNDNYETGARQHMERSARPALIGSLGPGEPYETFDDIIVGERNGPGGIYRDALDALGQSDVAATRHDDMRAIGAPNPEIGEHPDVTFSGYVLEAAVPFGFADLDDDGETNDDFVPSEGDTMGFSLFWNDTDGDTDEDFGVDLITRIMWTQTGNVFLGAGWGEIEFVGGGLEGDYNGSGELDAGDLDMHAQFVSDGNLVGDVNGDGTTDDADRLAWIKTLQKSWLGDSNFDGEFNSGDLVAVFTAGKYETQEVTSYAEGDWNGDRVFNSSDLVAAFTDGGYERGPLPAAAIPEPASASLLILGLVLLFRFRVDES